MRHTEKSLGFKDDLKDGVLSLTDLGKVGRQLHLKYPVKNKKGVFPVHHVTLNSWPPDAYL